MRKDIIEKIEKARRYAQEPQRVSLEELRLKFTGGNNRHEVSLVDGQWHCDCEFFRVRRTCAHVMAIQKMFAPMLAPELTEVQTSNIPETALLSESSLAQDWNRPEEDEAWQHLQGFRSRQEEQDVKAVEQLVTSGAHK